MNLTLFKGYMITKKKAINYIIADMVFMLQNPTSIKLSHDKNVNNMILYSILYCWHSSASRRKKVLFLSYSYFIQKYVCTLSIIYVLDIIFWFLHSWYLQGISLMIYPLIHGEFTKNVLRGTSKLFHLKVFSRSLNKIDNNYWN